jgi:cytochrome c biogenesis protein CcmG/thiol:disulfide interchange protein DsbE
MTATARRTAVPILSQGAGFGAAIAQQRRVPSAHAFSRSAVAFCASPGQVVVVDFFAAYCKPCQRTLPLLEALHRKQPGLTIVGVSLDDTPDNAWKSVRRHRLTFPVVHDAGNVLAGRMRVTELPISFVVDGGGRVRWVGGPDQPYDALERAIAAIPTASP